MKFEITRTSEYKKDIKPTAQAKEATDIIIDKRSRPLNEIYRAFITYGKNHKDNNDGTCQREINEKYWYIEIDSLDELVALMEVEGEELILRPTNVKDCVSRIEIYDDHRE